jgi:hypothetical protein
MRPRFRLVVLTMILTLLLTTTVTRPAKAADAGLIIVGSIAAFFGTVFLAAWLGGRLGGGYPLDLDETFAGKASGGFYHSLADNLVLNFEVEQTYNEGNVGIKYSGVEAATDDFDGSPLFFRIGIRF